MNDYMLLVRKKRVDQVDYELLEYYNLLGATKICRTGNDFVKKSMKNLFAADMIKKKVKRQGSEDSKEKLPQPRVTNLVDIYDFVNVCEKSSTESVSQVVKQMLDVIEKKGLVVEAGISEEVDLNEAVKNDSLLELEGILEYENKRKLIEEKLILVETKVEDAEINEEKKSKDDDDEKLSKDSSSLKSYVDFESEKMYSEKKIQADDHEKLLLEDRKYEKQVKIFKHKYHQFLKKRRLSSDKIKNFFEKDGDVTVKRKSFLSYEWKRKGFKTKDLDRYLNIDELPTDHVTDDENEEDYLIVIEFLRHLVKKKLKKLEKFKEHYGTFDNGEEPVLAGVCGDSNEQLLDEDDASSAVNIPANVCDSRLSKNITELDQISLDDSKPDFDHRVDENAVKEFLKKFCSKTKENCITEENKTYTLENENNPYVLEIYAYVSAILHDSYLEYNNICKPPETEGKPEDVVKFLNEVYEDFSEKRRIESKKYEKLLKRLKAHAEINRKRKAEEAKLQKLLNEQKKSQIQEVDLDDMDFADIVKDALSGILDCHGQHNEHYKKVNRNLITKGEHRALLRNRLGVAANDYEVGLMKKATKRSAKDEYCFGCQKFPLLIESVYPLLKECMAPEKLFCKCGALEKMVNYGRVKTGENLYKHLVFK